MPALSLLTILTVAWATVTAPRGDRWDLGLPWFEGFLILRGPFVHITGIGFASHSS